MPPRTIPKAREWFGLTTKRVLHVLYNLDRSGMEMMLLNSREEWMRQGYQCDVLATAPSAGPLANRFRVDGFGVFHFPFRSSVALLPRIDFVRRFHHLCRSGYDVVHIHAEGGSALFAVIARLAGVRCIAVTPHNTFRFAGLLRCRKFMERLLLRRLGARYGMISEGVAACEWTRFRNKGARIWNWLDTEQFRPPTSAERIAARQGAGVGADELVLLSVGNCNAAKNHTGIFCALALLPQSLRLFYIHVGREEPDGFERRLAASLGIRHRVLFLGSVGDLRHLLWCADAFVMPSLHEGLGVAALEAVASGLPLICSQTDGLADIAAETNNTVLTSTTPESIAAALTAVAAMPTAVRRARAEADSVLVRNRFSIRNGVRSVICGLYQEDMSVPPVPERVWGRS